MRGFERAISQPSPPPCRENDFRTAMHLADHNITATYAPDLAELFTKFASRFSSFIDNLAISSDDRPSTS